MAAMKEQEWQAFMDRIASEAKKAGMSKLEYRLRTFYWIVDERKNKLVKFVPNPVQTFFLRHFWWLTFVLKARQHGVSTLMALVMLDGCLFSANFRTGIIDKTDLDAKKKLAKMQFAYENLGREENGKPFLPGLALKEAIKQVAPTNDHTMTFSNGSSCYAATNHRGGTLNILWVSEFGYIAANDPIRAQEIASGSFNTVHPGNIIVIETTHEGGRFGLSYDMIRAAQSKHGELSPMQFKLLFFGWWENPEYALNVPKGTILTVPLKIQTYFASLERDVFAQRGVRLQLSDAQKNWYVQKSAIPGTDMARQYPGTIEEALTAQTEGAIYGDIMLLLRAKGRVRDMEMDGHAPLFTSSDIGMSDYQTTWLLQHVGSDVYALDYLSMEGATPAQWVAKILEWERQYRPIAMHFLPHDADNRGNSGKTYKGLLADAGIKNTRVVPVTKDKWVGINALRGYLPNFYFHATNCEKVFKGPVINGQPTELPSGLASIEGYRKKLEAKGGSVKEEPVHDEASHGADGLRTWAEARMRGMLKDIASSGPSHTPNKVTIIRDKKDKERQFTIMR